MCPAWLAQCRAARQVPHAAPGRPLCLFQRVGVTCVLDPKCQVSARAAGQATAPSVKNPGAPCRFELTTVSSPCRTRETTSSYGRSNFDPWIASGNRPICLSLFPTWPLRGSIASMSIGRHRLFWTRLTRASCRMRGTTNSFDPSNFDPQLVFGSQPIFPFPRPIWPLLDSIASMSISRHRRAGKALTTGALLSVRALVPA